MVDATLTTSWLAARHGVDPVRIERQRRAGELLATRVDGEWRYPAWQFDGDGRVLPAVAKLLELARHDRIPHDRLEELLYRRIGLVGGKSLRELLLNGGSDQAIAEVRGAA